MGNIKAGAGRIRPIMAYKVSSMRATFQIRALGTIAALTGAVVALCGAWAVWSGLHGHWGEFIHPQRLSARIGQVVAIGGGLIALIAAVVAYRRKNSNRR